MLGTFGSAPVESCSSQRQQPQLPGGKLLDSCAIGGFVAPATELNESRSRMGVGCYTGAIWAPRDAAAGTTRHATIEAKGVRGRIVCRSVCGFFRPTIPRDGVPESQSPPWTLTARSKRAGRDPLESTPKRSGEPWTSCLSCCEVVMEVMAVLNPVVTAWKPRRVVRHAATTPSTATRWAPSIRWLSPPHLESDWNKGSQAKRAGCGSSR